LPCGPLRRARQGDDGTDGADGNAPFGVANHRRETILPARNCV
jgi:hypothetical protein